MRWISQTITTRTQSPRLSAAGLQLAVGRRGLGPRDEKDQRTQRAFFVATCHSRVHTAAAAKPSCWSRWARMLGRKKYHVKHLGTSLHGQARVRQRRRGCLLSPGSSEVNSASLLAAPVETVVDVGLNFRSPRT